MTLELRIEQTTQDYKIVIGHSFLQKLGEYVKLPKKVMIVTDTNIPREYIYKVANLCQEHYIHPIIPGERSKTMVVYQRIIEKMLNANFTRSDMVIAIGGGVVGDLAGFVAATYKRGVRFINIPTSMLAMVDSSIGGKVAVNVNNIKNCVGAFYQPELVMIDIDTLESLPSRHLYNGLVEALKSGLIADKDLYNIFANASYLDKLDEVIIRSLQVKKSVVEADPYEKGLRKILNFGHTIGHAIETLNINEIYHGEAVAEGMLYFVNPTLKEELTNIIHDMGINLEIKNSPQELMEIIKNDKKAKNDMITVVKVNEIGRAELVDISFADLESIVKEV